jgi:hypothetical protein
MREDIERDAKRKEPISENELLFRGLNERIEEMVGSDDDPTMFASASAAMRCASRLSTCTTTGAASVTRANRKFVQR